MVNGAGARRLAVSPMKTHAAWFVACIATLVIGMQFGKATVRVGGKPVEVIKEVPQDVVQTVEVPAPVTPDTVQGLNLWNRWKARKLAATPRDWLAGLNSVNVAVLVSEDAKEAVSESEIRTEIELTLRRHQVPLDKTSICTFYYEVDSVGDELVSYATHASLNTAVFSVKPDQSLVMGDQPIWLSGKYGSVEPADAHDALISAAESDAEQFANDWLAANPTK